MTQKTNKRPTPYWLIMPEAEDDNGKHTGRFFGAQYEVIFEDPITGDLELSENPINNRSVFFETRNLAVDFLKKNKGSIVD